MGIILDAGPVLNFLAVNQQNILIKLAESQGLKLAVPEIVEAEITRKSTRDTRFARTPAAATWQKLTTNRRVEVLSDDVSSSALLQAIARISGKPAQERLRIPESLGEILVIAHASVLAAQGTDVFLLIDDTDGRQRALREMKHLRAVAAPGAVRLWSTPQILSGSDPAWVSRGQSWQRVYQAMRAFDDGLVPLDAYLKRGS